MNRLLLQIEGFMVFMLSIGYYSTNEYNWWLFAILLLAPDVSMVGYFINPSFGARLYNFFHTYIMSILLIMVGFLAHQDLILAVGIIWTAHIAMDRALGFGLKYPTSFKDTHIQRI